MRWRLLALILGLVVLVPPGVGIVIRAAREREIRALSRELDASIRSFDGRRDVRPVHRGEPIDGNARAAIDEALAEMGDLSALGTEDVSRGIREGAPTAETLELARRHSKALLRLRSATRRTYSWNATDLSRGAEVDVPPIVGLLRAVKLLLAQALTGSPDECLRIVADSIRLGQDLAPGAGFIGLMAVPIMTHLAVPVAQRCAPRADEASLRRAAAELRVLATSQPGVAEALEIEAIFYGVTARHEIVEAPLIPRDVRGFQRWWYRNVVLEAWREVGSGAPRRWRRIGETGFPGVLPAWQAELDRFAGSPNPLVGPVFGGGHLRRYIVRTGEALALIEALAISHATMAEQVGTGAVAARPAWVDDPALADPFTGEPLVWRFVDGGTALEISWRTPGHGPRPDGEGEPDRPGSPDSERLSFPLVPAGDAASTAQP